MKLQDSFQTRARSYFDTPWLSRALAFIAERMEQDGGHDWGHLLRVLHNAQAIREGEDETASWEVIAASVLFHDVVNLPKDHPQRRQASQLSAEAAVEFLTSEGLPKEELALVHEAIRCHSFSSGLTATSIEAKIVADADRLESIGALGIARTFCVTGVLGQSLFHAFDPFAEHRELDDLQYAVDHFYKKLLILRDRLYTDTARQLAEQRHAFMVQFLDQLRAELP